MAPRVTNLLGTPRDGAHCPDTMASDESGYVERLYRAHRERLFRVAMVVGVAREAAWDVVHEVFRDVLAHTDRYRAAENIEAYLVTAAVHTARKSRIAAKRHESRPLDEALDAPTGPQSGGADLLRGLPEPEATALLLHYRVGLSYSEIAAAMKVSVRHVETLLERGRAALRTRLDPDDHPREP